MIGVSYKSLAEQVGIGGSNIGSIIRDSSSIRVVDQGVSFPLLPSIDKWSDMDKRVAHKSLRGQVVAGGSKVGSIIGDSSSIRVVDQRVSLPFLLSIRGIEIAISLGCQMGISCSYISTMVGDHSSIRIVDKSQGRGSKEQGCHQELHDESL